MKTVKCEWCNGTGLEPEYVEAGEKEPEDRYACTAKCLGGRLRIVSPRTLLARFWTGGRDAWPEIMGASNAYFALDVSGVMPREGALVIGGVPIVGLGPVCRDAIERGALGLPSAIHREKQNAPVIILGSVNLETMCEDDRGVAFADGWRVVKPSKRFEAALADGFLRRTTR